MSVISAEFDQSFTANGHQLVYDIYGPSSAPLVVYMHGLLMDSELNRGIAQALAEQGYRSRCWTYSDTGGATNRRMRRSTVSIATRIRSSPCSTTLVRSGPSLAVFSLGANVSLFAADRYPTRVRALVLEMPVLERAVPAAALFFVPILLAAHYGRRVVNVTSGVMSRIPRTRFGPLNSLMNATSLSPDVIAAVLHGVLVGPTAPTQEQRRAVQVPVLVLAHRNDLIHPFDDAVSLVERTPNSVLVRARSPLELRLRPKRLTDAIVAFLSSLEPESARGRSRRPA